MTYVPNAHRRPRRARVLLLLLTLVLTGLATWTTTAPAVAAPCDAPVVSPVACENTKPGTPQSTWGINGAGDANIQGFATEISVDQGGTVGFKVDTNASSYRLDIYRMGYYNGDGARKVTTVLPTVLNNQPNCITAAATGLVDCGNWTQNASWQVPADAVSGIYFAHAVRTDSTPGESHIVFIVRDDDGGSDLLFQTSDTTWQAYNSYGGNSLYTGSPAGRAYKVSYNRPFTTRNASPEDWVFNAEYPMVRFLESNGYDVSYTTGLDSHRRGNELTEHEAFLSVGHDEYWSGTQRTNVELARAAGVDLAFFSGNEVFWKTRWENSIDGSNTPNRTLVTYKETHANAKIDPAGASTWTGTWRDPRFSPPGDGGRPENALTGTIFTMNCCAIDMQVGADDGKMRFWRNTRVANLTGTQTTTVGTNIIGYEWDEDLDNGHRPAGAFRVSETEGTGDRILDQGSTYGQGPGTHAMTMYRHPSGALVFGAGTIQWAWGLDSQHDRGSAPADVAAQQATVNLFAEMGAQPTTRQPALVAATASTDTVAPTSAITAPAAGATVQVGSPLTVSGTAADTGGGRVGGVEVSTDDGTTWHRATGRESWSYSFNPTTTGSLTLRVRATDDSANTQTPGAGVTINVGNPSVTCPCTIWPSTTVGGAAVADAPVELGVRFRANTNGFINGIRYYKPTGVTGTHVGSLWTNTGTRLATVNFTNETASGWQQATFPTPVAVTAGTTYVASYYAPSRYSQAEGYFADAATTRGPLTALRDGTDGANGVYRYSGTASVFPNQAWESANYWVDVVFSEAADTTKPTLSARTPAPGATGVAVGVDATAGFNEAVQQATIAFQLTGPGSAVVPAALSYDAASRTATLNPTAALAGSTTYTARVSGARDTAGNTMDAVTWTFTTEAPDTTKPTVTARTPAPGATGVSVGSTPTATFSEAVQQATISMVLRNPGGTIVPSTTAYDAATRTVTLSPTAALASTTAYTVTLSGARDPSGNTMDTITWTFTTEAQDTIKPTVTARNPAPGDSGVAANTGVTATFSEAVQQATIALELRTPGGTVVPSSTAYNATTRTITLTPTGALTANTTYTVNLSGARDPSGNTMDPLTWTFTTLVNTSNCPCTIWPTTTVGGDAVVDSPVELGTRFRASSDGFITGIRYYKPTGVTGTHVGSLWTNTGTRLANITFTNETASGWQQADFTSPVAVTAGTTYVASYYAPSRYSQTESYFADAATTRGPLTALRDGTDGANGLYRYSGTASVFPNQGWASANYWVDVVFTEAADTAKPTVSARTPAPGATGVVASADATAVFSEAVQQATITFQLTGPGGAAVPAAVSYDAASRTATLNPNANLANSTAYTATLSGARDTAGNLMDPLTWTFTTEATPPPDTTKPTVTARAPSPGSTGVGVGSDTTADFSEAVQQATIAFELRGPGNALVPSTTTYNATTRRATLDPTANLANSTAYTATLSGARDTAGNLMDPVTWSFTTAAASTSNCPCTIWPTTTDPGAADQDSSVELGVRFRATSDGFITGIRYFKATGVTGTHVGSLWTGTGTRLSNVTFTNETPTGWQQADFAGPVPVTAGTTYVASYFAPSGYVSTGDYFAAAATTRGPLTALRDGVDGANGVYKYAGAAGAFPDATWQSANYWVDVVFNETSSDTTAPTVTGRTPSVGATGQPVTTQPTVTFSEPVQAGTISMVLRNSVTSQVMSSTVSYAAGTFTATLSPALSLASSTPYNVTVSGARDPSGNTMAPVTWAFETGAPPPPLDTGPGGPIALVTSDANKSSSYLVEIARAEGLNEFANIKNTTLSAATLAPYSVVVLGDVAITDAQVTALTSWVNAGGNLILMRPDSRLLPLAGLSAQAGSVANGYLRVNAATEPGAGITTETMQFHGTANNYALTSATTVAELYNTATTGTGRPAVSWRSVGTSGGQVATFAYDLATSVIWTRQGNPAWAGTDRDGDPTPNRSNDLFFGGGSTPDWVNLNKVAIPQADEQQRLLANLVTVMARDRMPMPRFWYFPGTAKAAVVATGDDHATGGTAGRFSAYSSASPAGCSVANWECPRFTSYVYPGSPLTNAQAVNYDAAGFEIGAHPQNNCQNYTSLAALQATYTSELNAWRSQYSGIPSPVTNRFHCMPWSDWASQPKAELANGMRVDTNYYYYPGSWLADRPGFMTGSGMPMRFTDTDGSMIDVYQATTVMTDESGQSYPYTSDTLLDAAVGPLGYYGAFTANLHTDAAVTWEDTQVLASATERGVPVITTRQLLTWVDGRNASSYTGLSWSGTTLSFTVNVGSGANRLTAMLPTTGPGGRTLTAVSRGSTPVAFTLMTVKGQQYAVFPASSGAHTATYGGTTTATIARAEASDVLSSKATVAWQTDTPASTALLLGTSPTTLRSTGAVAELTGSHQVALDSLSPGTTYYYRVRSKSPDRRSVVWPALDRPPATFTTKALDRLAPSTRSVRVSALPDGTARVTWRTDEPTTAVVRLRNNRGRLMQVARDDSLTRHHALVMTGLTPRRLHTVLVSSIDADDNSAPTASRGIRGTAPGVAIQSLAEFRTGTWSGSLRVDESGFGSLTMTGAGRATYTSRVIDSGHQTRWLRAFLKSSVPAGTTATVQVRTGPTASTGSAWSQWTASLTDGDRLRRSGRFLQYRVVLTATGDARPVVTGIGFSDSASADESHDDERGHVG